MISVRFFFSVFILYLYLYYIYTSQTIQRYKYILFKEKKQKTMINNNEYTKVIPLMIYDVNNTKLLLEVTAKYNNNKSFIEWCKLYISLSPNTLQNILDTISDVILDNEQIEVVDIPNMVLLIVSNVLLTSKQYDIVSSEHILNFTKLIIHMIIDYELFAISPILQNNIVVEAMINACLELIMIDLNVKPAIMREKKGFWDWIISFFY